MNRITLKNPLNHPLNLLTGGNEGWKNANFILTGGIPSVKTRNRNGTRSQAPKGKEKEEKRKTGRGSEEKLLTRGKEKKAGKCRNLKPPEREKPP